MSNKTPWLTYALLGGAAYVAYKLYENYLAGQAAPAGTSPILTSEQVQPQLPAPNGQVLPTGEVLAPVPGQQLPVATVLPSMPNGIPQQVYSVVQSWANDDRRAPVLAFAAANVPSEYAGMYDIITNYWDLNIAPGPTQTAFWNALRAKYDPGDAIW